MSLQRIANGAQVQVVLNGVPIGLATGCGYDEDFALNPAKVIGMLGPIDYDSQDYTCSITLGSYKAVVPGDGPWPDGGQKTISDFIPIKDDIVNNLNRPNNFDTLQFMNVATGNEANRFRGVSIASNGEQVSPNSYVTKNIRLLAIKREV